MPFHRKLQSLFEEFDAKVEAKLGGGQTGYTHQHAMPYNTPTGQYAGPGAAQIWGQQPQYPSHMPNNQWQQSQPSGSHLGVPQSRPRANSSPGAREPDHDSIPSDAPPSYNEVAGSSSKPTSAEKNPALPGDHWAPTNPFRDPGSSSSQPNNFPSQQSQDQKQQQYSPPKQQMPTHFPPYGQQQQPTRPPSGIQPMFPLTFDMWYNTGWKSSKTELHMAGQPPNNPAFVATFSLGWKGKTELHERHAQGPMLMSAKSSNTSGTKQNMVFPDGSIIELKTPDLRKYYFVMNTGPGGLPEKFRWKKAHGGDMREVSPVYMGWKLTKDGTDEVLAVFGEKVGWKNGAGGGTFAFVGAGRSGMRGAHWQNVAVFSFIKVTHDKFVEGIANPIASAVS